MPRPTPRCRCDTGRKRSRCCGPILAGRLAKTPLELMRSRYTAYALGDVDHIIETTARDGPHWREDEDAWQDAIERSMEGAVFQKLTILDAPEPVGDEGKVSFEVRVKVGGVSDVTGEHSRFVLRDGVWLYWGAQS